MIILMMILVMILVIILIIILIMMIAMILMMIAMILIIAMSLIIIMAKIVNTLNTLNRYRARIARNIELREQVIFCPQHLKHQDHQEQHDYDLDHSIKTICRFSLGF